MSSDVAAKELKNRLGHYLRLVRAGATFVVTDRGRPVAELTPLAETLAADREHQALTQAAAKGLITLPRRSKWRKFRPAKLKRGAALSDIVIEDRR